MVTSESDNFRACVRRRLGKAPPVGVAKYATINFAEVSKSGNVKMYSPKECASRLILRFVNQSQDLTMIFGAFEMLASQGDLCVNTSR